MSYLEKFLDKMKKENLHPIVQRSFQDYYQKIINGETGLLTEQEITPPSFSNIIDYKDLSYDNKDGLEKLAVIKLNGGLGTSMGLKKAKSLLTVKDKYNFLDIIAKQILHLRNETGKKLPLLFMNSFNTREDTLEYLKKYPELTYKDLPLDFVQNKFPKVQQKDLSPLQSDNDHLNWNPPGHGEIYLTMNITGVLDTLIDQGFEYAFISNADNLGATPDNKIASLMIDQNIPFLMEVCQRTEMDKKGGHLAETNNGQLILREVAQCPENEIENFQDIQRYKFFNTNNLWVNLKYLKKEIQKNNGYLPLPLIRNKKIVDDVPVYQIETAMGAAINVFEDSKAIIIPRSRFLPVKKTNDLLALWSDAFYLDSNFSLQLSPLLKETPVISLDDHYHSIDDLLKHCKKGIPSLKNCEKLEIKGDVYFGENVTCNGDVKIFSKEKCTIKNLTLENETKFE